MRAEGPALLVTDGRYAEQAEAQLATAGVSTLVELAIAGRDANGVLASRIPGETSLGLEAEHVTWADHRRYASEWLPGIELVPTEGLVGGLRAVKDDAELEQCVRNFLTLLLYSLSSVTRVAPLLYGDVPSDPLATST